MLLKFFAVFIGGGFGSSLRWLLGLLINKYSRINFPLSTLIINILGSLLLGFLSYHFLNKADIKEELKLMLTIGFCGGFTTFSTFAYENFYSIQEGEIIKSILYIILSVILSVLMIFLGAIIAKNI